MLSVILTASVLFPDMGENVILAILAGGSVLTIVTAIAVSALGRKTPDDKSIACDPALRLVWRMPPLDELPATRLTLRSRIWMFVLRGYLFVAGGLVLFRIFQLATVGA
jgi:hypothetical protein